MTACKSASDASRIRFTLPNALRSVRFLVSPTPSILSLSLIHIFCSYGGEPNPDLMDIETVLTAKIVLIDDEDKLKEYARELRITFPEFLFTKAQTGLLEVMNPEATKESAIAFIAGKLGIEQQQVIAIGDNSIDAGMIAYAGLGVAMGNAPEELKKNANYVCGTCEQSGVAEVIDKYILGV